MEGADGVESGNAEAAEPGTLDEGSLWRLVRENAERIAGVELIDTIMEAAQTRFFERAVADPAAIGDLWPASIHPSKRRRGAGGGGREGLEGSQSILGSKQ